MNLPEYPGGKEAFRKYIKENLVYPKEALDKKVEGVVHLKAEVNDNGKVLQVQVEKGIGAGCDEEAVRLIENIQYYAVKNRGIRLKTKKKYRIEFRLPKRQIPSKTINFEVVKKKSRNETKHPKSKVYSYSVRL